MTFSVYRGEKRLSDLTTRVFGKLRAADAKRASAALLAANPELEHPERLSTGRPFVVPEVEGLAPRAEADLFAPRSQLAAAALAELEAHATRIREAAKTDRVEIGEAREVLASEELRALVGRNRVASEVLRATEASLEEREAMTRERSALLKVLKRATDDLTGLAGTSPAVVRSRRGPR